MQIGIFQCDGGGLTPDQRLSKLSEVARKHQLDMIVCPELFVSGYNVGDNLIEYADTADGKLIRQTSAIARASGTTIVIGYPERDGTNLYNAACCIDSAGQVLANHRKLMLPPGFEPEYFTPGIQTTLFEIGGLTFALLICYDAEYPEAVRHMAQAGAQVILVPTALSENWPAVSGKLMPTRAFENGVWLVYANHAGTENGLRYLGGSCIVRPDGVDAARAGDTECVISADVDSDSVQLAQARLPYLEGASILQKKLK